MGRFGRRAGSLVWRMKRWMTALVFTLVACVALKGFGMVGLDRLQNWIAGHDAGAFLMSAAGRLFRYQYPAYRGGEIWEETGPAGWEDLSERAVEWGAGRMPLFRLLVRKEPQLFADDPAYRSCQDALQTYADSRDAPGADAAGRRDVLRYQGEDGNITIYEGADEADRQAYSNGGVTVRGTSYRVEQLADYDFLMKEFFSVHASTTAPRELMDAGRFLGQDFHLERRGEGNPQILIYHTHSQEEYAGGGQVTGVGGYLAQLLEKKGYTVIHDTSPYDLQGGKLDRSTAYNYALDGITAILNEYPSVEVVLDLHRDGVREGLHLVSEVGGKDTAPIMFFNGMSQTPDGPIEYLPNPYLEQNLAFSFQMQLEAAARFPGWTRKIYLKGLRYNLHLRPRSALIEVGAQTNTYQEALNAMEPLAEVLGRVLKGE